MVGVLGRMLRAAWVLLAIAPLALATTNVPDALRAAEVTILERADAVASPAQQPPTDDASWRAVALPDNWYRSRPKFEGQLWYRMRFVVPEGPIRT